MERAGSGEAAGRYNGQADGAEVNQDATPGQTTPGTNRTTQGITEEAQPRSSSSYRLENYSRVSEYTHTNSKTENCNFPDDVRSLARCWRLKRKGDNKH